MSPFVAVSASDPCPCCSGMPFDRCCGPLLRGEAPAPTAERLMRSRFTAFAVGDVDYLLATWHPSTRPRDLRLDEEISWTRLIINDTSQGSLFDDHGVVEFTALYTYPDASDPGRARHGRQHERSTFARADGAWTYVDGEL